MLEGRQALVFDCDGVLIDSEPIANAVLAACLHDEVGYRISAEESHRRFTGKLLCQIAEELAPEIGRPMPDGWVDRHHAALDAALARGLQSIPGVLQVIDRLDAAGVPWGVASQSRPDYLEHCLGLVGIYDRARGRIASAQEVARPKPAPDVYLLACERVGCDPRQTLVVEDSPTGVRAGVAAGATVIGFAADRPAEELRSAGASATVTAMPALATLLGLA